MTTLYCIPRAAFLIFIAAVSVTGANTHADAVVAGDKVDGSMQREVKVTNGESAGAQQYPFLTAVMSGRKATVTIGSALHEGFFFGASEPVEFSAPVVDCGLALAPCALAADRVCSIVFDFPDPTGALQTPAQQLDNCRLGGGIGAVFRAGPQSPVSLNVDSDLSLIPAVYLVTVDGRQAMLNLIASGSDFTVRVTPRLPQTILCGGTYLGGNWVLTAAHCVVDGNAAQRRIVEPYELLVNVAAFDLAAETSFIQPVTEVITNDYHTNGPWGINDYALLRLESLPVRGEGIDFVSGIELESLAASAAPAVVVGWGSTVVREPLTPVDQNLSTSNFPLQATLNLHTVDDCRILWRDFFLRNSLDSLGLVINQNHQCASNIQFQQDTCQGDSGGPLLVSNNEGELKLAGITNFGLGCGSSQSAPGVYASVPSFASWVNRITGLPAQDFDRLSGSQSDRPQSVISGGGTIGSLSVLFILMLVTGPWRALRQKEFTIELAHHLRLKHGL